MYFTYGKEDAREGYGTVEWVDDYGTLGQEKEVSYDIVGIPCELPREKTLFKHIRESKIQSIDEMEIVKIERKDRCIFILQVIHIGALTVLKIFAMNMKLQQSGMQDIIMWNMKKVESGLCLKSMMRLCRAK